MMTMGGAAHQSFICIHFKSIEVHVRHDV